MRGTRLLAALLAAVLVSVAVAGCSGEQRGGGEGGPPTATPDTTGTQGATSPPNPPTGTPNPGTGGGQQEQSGRTVVERDLAFRPATLEVSVGDTVTFVNVEPAPHRIRIDGADLGEQRQGQSVTWTATRPGNYPYICMIHPQMRGEIIVSP